MTSLFFDGLISYPYSLYSGFTSISYPALITESFGNFHISLPLWRLAPKYIEYSECSRKHLTTILQIKTSSLFSNHLCVKSRIICLFNDNLHNYSFTLSIFLAFFYQVFLVSLEFLLTSFLLTISGDLCLSVGVFDGSRAIFGDGFIVRWCVATSYGWPDFAWLG